MQCEGCRPRFEAGQLAQEMAGSVDFGQPDPADQFASLELQHLRLTGNF